MSRKLYTQHKLSDAALRRLSSVVNGRHRLYGVSLESLVKKGLVVGDDIPHPDTGSTYSATQAGVQALTDARREGW